MGQPPPSLLLWQKHCGRAKDTQHQDAGKALDGELLCASCPLPALVADLPQDTRWPWSVGARCEVSPGSRTQSTSAPDACASHSLSRLTPHACISLGFAGPSTPGPTVPLVAVPRPLYLRPHNSPSCCSLVTNPMHLPGGCCLGPSIQRAAVMGPGPSAPPTQDGPSTLWNQEAVPPTAPDSTCEAPAPPLPAHSLNPAPPPW